MADVGSGLTQDVIDKAIAGLQSRGAAAIEQLEGKKSYFGSWGSNNDTITQTQGAIRIVLDVGVPSLRSIGRKAMDDPDQLVSYVKTTPEGGQEQIRAIDSWNKTGTDYSKVIDDIDHYGIDAAFSTVVSKTIDKSVQDVKDAAPFLAIGGLVVVAAIGVGIVVYLKFMTRGGL